MHTIARDSVAPGGGRFFFPFCVYCLLRMHVPMCPLCLSGMREVFFLHNANPCATVVRFAIITSVARLPMRYAEGRLWFPSPGVGAADGEII